MLLRGCSKQLAQPHCLTKPQTVVHRSTIVPSTAQLTANSSPAATSGHPLSSMATLISFDVDGTLIRSVGDNANKLHKEAFSAGFKEVFGVDTHIDVIAHHGSTDPLIIIKVMQHHGYPKDEVMSALPKVQIAMNNHFTGNAHRAAEGIEMLPGVKALLQALQSHGSAASCLVTGNLEPIGWTKMKALGIHDHFSAPQFGGFGSDFCSGNTEESWRDRAQLVRIAAEKGQLVVSGAAPEWKARYHVGDTPMDVQAALDAGAIAIGVTTGIFTAEQLRAAAPADAEESGKLIIFPDLSDTQQVLKALGLD